MTTSLICWARTPYDTRQTASTTMRFIVGKTTRSAVDLARQIDEWGATAIADLTADGIITPARTYDPHHRVAAGHGVVIVYPGGRTRKVRWLD